MSATRRAVVRSSALVAGLAAASQLLGFVRDAVMAAVFGASAAVDAFLVAQGLMNLVLGLVTGAMARALIPTVARAVDAGEPERGHRTVRVALTVTVSVLLAGSVVMYLTAEPLLDVLAPGFDHATAHEAVRLTRILLVATVFVAGTNLLAATAQAHGRFFWSGLEGIPFNVVMIVAAGVFGVMYGATSLAIGFVVGSLARFLFQLPAVRSIRLRLRPSVRLRDAGFREMLPLVPPLLLGTAIVNVNTMVDRAVGSAQGTGTIAALSYGWRIVTIAEVVLVLAFAATLFPAFSTLGGVEQRARLRRATERVLGIVVVLISPLVVVLAVGAKPIVVLVFARGNFDEHAISLTALSVAMYAISLAGLAVREVVARTCLAVGDGHTPVATAVGAMALNVVGDLTLGVRYGVTGLALSTSISVVFAAASMSVLAAWRHRAVALGPFARTTAKVFLACAFAAGAAWLVLRALPVDHAGHALLALGGVATVCFATYTGVLLLLRVPALTELRESLRDLRIRPRT
jgi:putative peptidoglycan lipid II flippase